MRSWDNYYQNDLDQQRRDHSEGDEDSNTEDVAELPDPSDLESWFDDVGAPAKTLEFLTSESFPLSPNYSVADDDDDDEEVEGESSSDRRPSVLDLGTGNGSALFSLRLEGEYTGRMVGVDYSSQSIELARKLCRQYFPPSNAEGGGDVTFEVLDLVNDDPTTKPWWPTPQGGFDLVLDKGTFDAVSLSSATVTDPATGTERRMCEFYPAKILDMVRPGGFLLITSCNWTEEEVVSWFTGAEANGTGNFAVYDRIKYPVFEFGGQKGQGVASVCFRKSQNPTSTR
ncbi:hypothetical protein PV08_11262 [Exophiala spinifera]|uniref:Protein-lysine N-methyltransferase EFM4 n=1 Tax=Exophiala spinifera TaxID=91928 RepID=A0A0D2AUW4_9EURO|nr:uncharacterized protein PV08_11262 [Exophiala spinifera]KIW10300.1 hypothetical protein PV08_11262 [Exophiala spinifera]